MTRPKPRQKNRNPMAMLGIRYPRHTTRRLAALIESGRVAEAQRIILDRLTMEIDGPPFRVSMKPGQRKRLVER